MLKEAKDPKSRPEALRQPQRKDSFSSVFSWAALQTKPNSSSKSSASSASASATTTPQSQSSSTGTNLKSRRYSHGPDIKKKTRDSSTASRRLSLSAVGGTQDVPSSKTRHTKTLSTSDSKTTDGVSSDAKTTKSSSTEKVNKQTQDGPERSPDNSQQKLPISSTSQDKSSSTPERPTSPKIVPKSILRVSSPDGQRPPRRIIAYPAPTSTAENGQQPSTGQSPLSPLDQSLPDIAEDAGPGSPPSSPITRPLSPGATVRFAKATIHRVEVGPGRRFAPVKRKSKSTLTYIAPLDPGANKTTPKNMLASPTKLRRHVENQKAMGRYWMRTEEEEAQWRAEAAMRAAEEAERYRAEPASPPGPAILANSPAFHGFSWAVDGLEALDKLPPIDSLPSLDKLETEEAEDKLETVVVSDSDDSDTESPDSGVSIFPMDGDQEEGVKQQPNPESTKANPDLENLKETKPAHQEGSSSLEVKVGDGGGGVQEVNNAKPTTTNTTLHEAKTTLSRPFQTSMQSDPKKTGGNNNTATTSRHSSIPTLTLSPSRPTSPTPRRISPSRPLSPPPSRPSPSKSLSTSAITDNSRERPYAPTLRSSSTNRLHLSGRRERGAGAAGGGGGGGGSGKRVLFDDHHAKHEIAAT